MELILEDFVMLPRRGATQAPGDGAGMALGHREELELVVRVHADEINPGAIRSIVTTGGPRGSLVTPQPALHAPAFRHGVTLNDGGVGHDPLSRVVRARADDWQ